MYEIIDSVGRIVAAAKLAKDAADKLKNAEMQHLVADVLSASVDLKLQAVGLKEELVQAKTENAALLAERDALRAKLDAAQKRAPHTKTAIDGHRYEQEMVKVLQILAEHDGSNIGLEQVARLIGKPQAVARHIMSELDQAELVIHHWGLGMDHGYSIGSDGTAWLIAKGLIG